ncbi:MAG TPA: 4Fe-4S dicluster domain-containing protein [Thermoanaerobaculia bacterium]|nr:4Fe-4S dicluster domain-containing protein [Thermoanaerobaculia bacterium]
MTLNRRNLFRIAGAAGAATVAGRALSSAMTPGAPKTTANAVLVDTTRCVGCRACEAACSEANQLAEPEKPGDAAVFASRRRTGPTSFTVVNKSTEKSPNGEDRYAKMQCMHCVSPACASGCVVGALEKTPAGPVVYHAGQCIGCRYCMIACPFSVPKYEYAKAAPLVKKCTFCAERQGQGLPPACTEACPSGALLFGKRADLLEEARTRIYQNPTRYTHEIYGEDEAGGTSWLYLSDVPFTSLALPGEIEKRSYPELAEGALSAVPLVATLWPPLLMGLYTFSKRRHDVAEEGNGRKGDGHE